MKPSVVTLLVAALLHLSVQAEKLHDIDPLDTLGDIKMKFPNASFSQVKAAWVKEGEDFYSMKGAGFPGELKIAFSDQRPYFKERVTYYESVVARGEDIEVAKLDLELFKKLASKPDNEALMVKWVRWIPTNPIPFERYKSKYGEPSKCDFSKDDMTPYCEWANRKMLVQLSDDRKMVYFVEAAFTPEEERISWQTRRGFVPDYLKNVLPALPQPVAPAKKVKPT